MSPAEIAQLVGVAVAIGTAVAAHIRVSNHQTAPRPHSRIKIRPTASGLPPADPTSQTRI